MTYFAIFGFKKNCKIIEIMPKKLSVKYITTDNNPKNGKHLVLRIIAQIIVQKC